MKYDFNDYELIYSIKDGNEKSLEVLLLKYDPYIIAYVTKIMGYMDEDFVQEGRLVLYNAIYSYKESNQHSFFSFFTLCLKRKISYLLYEENKYKNNQ